LRAGCSSFGRSALSGARCGSTRSSLNGSGGSPPLESSRAFVSTRDRPSSTSSPILSSARASSFDSIRRRAFSLSSRSASSSPRWGRDIPADPDSRFFYSGEARQYALLAAVSFFLFLAALRARDGWKPRLAAAAAAAALPWIHYLGLFVVAGSVILCLVRKKRASALLQIAGASLFLVWVPIARAQPSLSLAWNVSAVSFPRVFAAFGFWGDSLPYFSGWRTPAAWAGVVLGAALLLAAAERARKSPAVRDALAFSILPLLFVFLASAFRPVYFPGRTEMATLPVALWAAARASRRSRAANVLTLAAAIGGFAVIAGSFVEPAGPFPYSETAKFLAPRCRSGDVVVAADANYLPLRLEKDRGTLAAPLAGLPLEVESHPGWFEPIAPSEIDAEAARLRLRVAAVPAGGRVELAIPPDPALRDLAQRNLGSETRRVLRPPGGYAILEIDR
jgi:hypothetical protein